MDGVVTAVTSAITGAVVSEELSVDELSDDEEELSVVVVLSSSEVDVVVDVLSLEEPPSSLPQEIMVKLKRNRERIMSICLIGFLIGYFRRTTFIPQFRGILQEF